MVVFPLATIGLVLQGDLRGHQLDVEDPTITTVLVWSFTIAACFLAFLTAAEAHLVCGGRVKKPRILATTFLLAIWAMPPILDLIRAEIVGTKDVYADMETSWILGCSPAGTIAEVWRWPSSVDLAGTPAKKLLPGLAFQIVLALSLGFWGHRVRDKIGEHEKRRAGRCSPSTER